MVYFYTWVIVIFIFAWEFISGFLLTVCLFWSVCHLLTIPIPIGLLLHLIAISIFVWELISSLFHNVSLLLQCISIAGIFKGESEGMTILSLSWTVWDVVLKLCISKVVLVWIIHPICIFVSFSNFDLITMIMIFTVLSVNFATDCL